MAKLSPEIVEQVIEACKAEADETAAAFQRALDLETEVSVGEPGVVDMGALPGGLDGSGLAIVLTVDDAAALLLVPETSGVLPSWYADPDETGRAKLDTLALELGETLLPDDCPVEPSAALADGNLAEVMARGGVSDTAAIVPLELRRAEGEPAVAYLVWPAKSPADLTPAEPSAVDPPAVGSPSADGGDLEPPAPQRTRPVAPSRSRSTRDLPPYTRSLLRIKVPVVVTLARKKQSVGKILDLGPGAIIQFDKSCEEMLELDVGGRPVAAGEAVKVGDKFGLRISSIVLPEERFRRVG